jgi:outer membrane protein assembly factor BamA
MLGNHQYYFLVNNTASDRRDFLSSFNFGASYFNLTKRTNYGGGAFHFVDDYFDDYSGWFFERQYGAFVTVSHPFSKFHRAEVSTILKKSEKENYNTDRNRRTILSSSFLSLIKDTSLWGPVGPVDGSRLKLSLGLTWEPRSGRVFNRAMLIDLRHYFRLSRRSCHAVRLAGRFSQGVEPQIFYMGGSWDMRGYPRRHFMGRKLILMNNELRFPVIDNLLVGFPFGAFELRAIRGAFFLDIGNAWNENLSLKKELYQVHGDFGFGLRARVGYFTVLRLDFAKTTDFDRIFPDTKVQFFFGWNY